MVGFTWYRFRRDQRTQQGISNDLVVSAFGVSQCARWCLQRFCLFLLLLLGRSLHLQHFIARLVELLLHSFRCFGRLGIFGFPRSFGKLPVILPRYYCSYIGNLKILLSLYVKSSLQCLYCAFVILTECQCSKEQMSKRIDLNRVRLPEPFH